MASCLVSQTVSFCLIFCFFSLRAPGKYHTTIYPYIHQTCNNRKSEDQVRPVLIPDVDPTDVPPNLNFSMAAGDFLEIYTEEGTRTKRLSMYFFSWQGACKTTAVPHGVTRSITATCREGELQAHFRFLLPLSLHTCMTERSSFRVLQEHNIRTTSQLIPCPRPLVVECAILSILSPEQQPQVYHGTLCSTTNHASEL